MRKSIFRRKGLLKKGTAAALSAALAFSMTPAVVFAQPADAATGDVVTMEVADIDTVKGLIEALPDAPEITSSESPNSYDEQIKAAADAHAALSKEDQDTLDSEIPSGGGQPYGRVLETAQWAAAAMKAVDNTTLLSPRTYDSSTSPALSSESSKGKSTSSRTRTWVARDVTVKDGKASATIVCPESKSYNYMYTSGQKFEGTAEGKTSVFENVPIDLNGIQYLSVGSSSMGTEITYSISVKLDEFSKIENNTGMFKVVSASLETTGDDTVLRFALSGKGYGHVFMGTFENAVADPTATEEVMVAYTANADGGYEFVVPVEKGVKTYPLMSISVRNYGDYKNGTKAFMQCVYPRMFTLDTENLTLVTGDFEADTELSSSVSGLAPKVTSASLKTVAGPPANNYAEALSVETDAIAAYLGTAEAAALATSGVADAVDGTITLTLTPDNRGGAMAAKGGWDGKADVAFKLAGGTWIDTQVVVDKNAGSLSISGATGWAEVDGKKYYFDEDGTVVTGWQDIDGKKYYFNPDGSIATGTVTIDGKQYQFNADGSMVTESKNGQVTDNKDAKTPAAKLKTQTLKVKKTVKVKKGKSVKVKVKGVKGKLKFKIAKKYKKFFKISVKKGKLVIKAKKSVKKGKKVKIKIWATATGSFKKSAVKTLTVKVK